MPEQQALPLPGVPQKSPLCHSIEMEGQPTTVAVQLAPVGPDHCPVLPLQVYVAPPVYPGLVFERFALLPPTPDGNVAPQEPPPQVAAPPDGQLRFWLQVVVPPVACQLEPLHTYGLSPVVPGDPPSDPELVSAALKLVFVSPLGREPTQVAVPTVHVWVVAAQGGLPA